MATGIVLMGGPGDGVVVAETIDDIHAVDVSRSLLGFLNDSLPIGTLVCGRPVLGRLEDWRNRADSVRFIAALHKVKQMALRAKRVSSLGIPADRWATVAHPTARIARDVSVGAGTYIGPYAVVQPGAFLGAHVSIRAGANIGHDAVVEDFAYIGPNATLCGRAVMRFGSHLGPNAVILDRRTIGRFSVVGMCSAVTKDVDDRVICLGNPARKVGVTAKEGTGF
jgi:sugar O-acyltransferase (sialic acid O-acetyltransferase NeuD family)